ncbi:uncharacterized protein LOC106154925 [Lingula anatina]|uniref:Uncharacterized protein LOC106154925 n=1 Tax=Lingula anatina TaxID=7574 RepID=A0A1S3HFV4_LINAN|nr:uncharacterized protein LOC106154925 [Lingula anatina]XP_013384935.1 uncharacterized protein LOC106154925 [Lingula anatina]|eukprot:XP_013384934.1 uncharacterized protein LOC106154925 [Lingula anatina]
MCHLGDSKSGFELFDEIPKGTPAVCNCDATLKMKIYVHFGKKPQETERQFEKLRENWTKIEEDLEPIDILSYLFEKKVLGIDDMDVIRNTLHRKDRCYELLKSLRKCFPEKEPMRHLCTILREKRPHLADLLNPFSETADDRAVGTADNI